MESLETAALFVDNLLDFSSDIGEDDYDDADNIKKNQTLCLNNHQTNNSADTTFPDSDSLPPVLVEEELEWLSNQDAFPPIEFEINQINQMIDMKPENIITNQSPVSVLGISNSNFRVPVKARSKKRRRRRNFSEFVTQKWWYNVEEPKKKNVGGSRNSTTSSSFIRRCLHCQADKTPQWRAGPLGPKTLCNACGVRYKSGRLLPEYRPASSPTFSEQVHSNSHRKVLDMRRSKQKDEVFLQPLELDMRRSKQKDEVFLQPLELDMRRSNQKDEVFLQPLEKGYEHKKRVVGQRRISASTTTTLGVKKRVIGQRRVSTSTTTTLGVRSCQHCQTKTTPEWREGPLGPRTLCNACGVRYKSGRLFPEYRPANSPSFSGELHSNSHKKVLDMRRQKQSLDEGR